VARALSRVPVAIDFVGAKVELLDLRDATFEEPFFRESVERARRERPQDTPLVVDLPLFVLSAARHPAPPDAFVFHVGRCGSTLLVNMLVRSGDYIALKEPDILNELVAQWITTAEKRAQIELVTAATIRTLLGEIATNRRRLLKFAAWNVQMAIPLLRMFPKTPAVFVVRSPAETVASQLHTPPAWIDIVRAPRRVQARFFPSIAGVPELERISPACLCAHAWRSAVEAARAVPAGRLLTIGYEELVTQPAATLRRLFVAWGRALEDDALERMTGALDHYSKDPNGAEPFEPLGPHRRPPLSAAQRSEVDAVAYDLWLAVDSGALAHPAGPTERVSSSRSRAL
jgi:hypothetical protein